jgi:hypothetical protein
MNAIFTIAAKNYLAHAKTLGDSVARYCPDYKFYIILADEAEGNISLESENYSIIEAKEFNIPKFKEMAFKYDIVEFCTSIKPFIFEELFTQYSYEHIFYLDPDTLLCDSLDEALESLKTDFLLLTPHLMKPYVNYEGSASEEELLFVGTFNLGFAAIRNCLEAKQFLAWWKEKLKNQCFADKHDALHVDQRWMDFAPSLYDHGVKIFRHPGYNVATWNLHEKEITFLNNKYFVNNSFKLVLYHFSGFDASQPNAMNKKQEKFDLNSYKILEPLFIQYKDFLYKNGYQQVSKFSYAYNKFDNGYMIVRFQRRLFRALLKTGYSTNDPFCTKKNSYYSLLKKNHLIIYEKEKNIDLTRKLLPDYKQKMDTMFKALLILKKIIGIKRYYLIMRFFYFYSRFEEQLFLLENRK